MSQLADELNIGQTEASVAVNNKRVNKSQWHTTFLTDGDMVTIITDECRY
ncbi:MAG: MoaD/ThiS family protein [Muribaculaceae bacterium]|nr:MoaD/ThiS family protein [Muribaculaceae bacterium]